MADDPRTTGAGRAPITPAAWGALGFTLLSTAAFVPRIVRGGNREFLIYLGVMAVLIASVTVVHRRVNFHPLVLWGLSLWGLLHLAGGLVPVPESWPIEGRTPVLYNLWLIPGLGPKKSQLLYEELGIRSLDQLRRAAARHRISKLKGFGTKTEDNILHGLDHLAQAGHRMLLSEATVYADALTRHLRQTPGLHRVEVAGSCRRRKETVGDLDVLRVDLGPVLLGDVPAALDELAEPREPLVLGQRLERPEPGPEVEHVGRVGPRRERGLHQLVVEPGLLRHDRGLRHDLGLAAEDLHDVGHLGGPVLQVLQRARARADEPVRADELRGAEAGAELERDLAERLLAHARHGGEDPAVLQGERSELEHRRRPSRSRASARGKGRAG